MRVNGGFFWMQKDSPVVVNEGCEICYNVFYLRPKWYQIIMWYRAFRLWLNLPYSRQIDIETSCIRYEGKDYKSTRHVFE